MSFHKNLWVFAIFTYGFALASTLGVIDQTRVAHASETDGTIDDTSHYAWSENTGWIDFGASQGNVHVNDSALSGYAYGENIGWISLNCSNTSSCGTVDYKVANNAEGTLTGYAWSENTGWIHFAPSAAGVTIDTSGNFAGAAYGENIGWIIFNCSTTSSCGTVSYKTKTDWRAASTRSSGVGTTSQISSGRGRSSVRRPIAMAVPPAGTAPGVTSPTTFPFEKIWPRYLHLRMVGEDVLRLQQFLNKQGYRIAVKGPGSPGNETKLFGILTYRALTEWQKDHKLPATGYFGPQTFALMITLGL